LPFGVTAFEMRPEEVGGALDTLAGSHPFQFTTTLDLNETYESNPMHAIPAAMAKDLHVNLPPGLIGDPSAIPTCSLELFAPILNVPTGRCPQQTVMGVAHIVVNIPAILGGYIAPWTVPLFNLEPATGEPARFGFIIHGNPVILNTAVRTGSDYGVTVNVFNITQIAGFLSSEVTFWGVPGDSRHDNQRGEGCLVVAAFLANGSESSDACPPLNATNPPPFLSLPTSCNGPMQATVEGDSWEQANQRQSEGLPVLSEHLAETELPALDGCNRLQFGPEIKLTPDEQATSEPSGLTVDVHVPQEVNGTGTGLDSSDVKDITVALPQGLILNPSAADGLQACTGDPAATPGSAGNEIGFTGFKELNPTYEPGDKTAQFSDEEASCPNAAKIASATIHSPLIPNPIEGFVYLASPQNFAGFPQENPFSSLVAMYIVAKDPVSGTLVKLPGSVSLNESTGQITSTFENNPELAFEDAELHFFGGERAPLATPAQCGTYTTNASFAPWSGNDTTTAQSHFEIDQGPYGAPCPNGSLPFSPTLSSETTNVNAGSFTPLSTTLSREDGQQSIQSVTLHYPPGVSGLLTGVELCGEAQANNGTCGPNSQIGETIVSVGLGGDPFTVTGGKAYITGPYEGAPFGLSIVNPAKAGPFDLQQGRPVIVRAKIEINPLTAALTVTTNTPAQGHSIPTIIEGFPLQIKHVNVLVNGGPDHANAFTFNPTSCNKTEITGNIASAEGSSMPVSDPFQVTNCAQLKFEPKLAVSTSGKTSKQNGASLTYAVTYPNAPFGTDANIHYVKVELPSELPSRLTTLQKACTQKQFSENPAGCPGPSLIGHAKAVVPNIPVPLEGPVYFVSNGGEAFPNLVMVLKGYGVTVELVGDTLIRDGVTSTTFNTVPDNPVTSFEITLPEGPYSALAANGNLCKPTVSKTVKKKVKVKTHGKTETITRKLKEQVPTSLTIPSEYIGQNGDPYKANVPIAVTGCPKAVKVKKATKKSKAKKHKKK
jgi:hypothetical protein